MRLNNFLLVTAAALLAAPLSAQYAPILPFARTMDLVVADTGSDIAWRLADLNQDGDYNDAGEVTALYDELVGPYLWTSPSCIVSDFLGTVYVGDVSTDAIYAMRDQNGDGDANDAGEARIFFDTTNASGVAMQQSQGITVDATGVVFVAVSNPSGGIGDQIIRLRDLNADGDANDLGEANVFYAIPGSTGTAAFSIPTKVLVGPDAAVYFADVGTGIGQRGVWRLFDSDGSGTIDASEAVNFWNPTPSNGQYWSLAIDQTGAFYLSEHVGDVVYRGVDADASGTITAAEQTVFYQTTPATWWDLAVREDGTLWLCDSDGASDKITRLVDLNSDGSAMGPNEATRVYEANLAATPIEIRGMAVMRAPTLTLSPPTAQVGSTINYEIRTSKPFELAVPALALSLIPSFSLAPFGSLEVDPFSVVLLGVGLSDASSSFVYPVTLPNNPIFIGTFGTQALCGDGFRLYLSNGALMTLTP